MYKISAFSLEGKTFIEQKQFMNGEILTLFCNLDSRKLERVYERYLPLRLEIINMTRYINQVELSRKLNALFSFIDDFILKLPPYSSFLQTQTTFNRKITQLFKYYSCLFDLDDEDDEEYEAFEPEIAPYDEYAELRTDFLPEKERRQKGGNVHPPTQEEIYDENEKSEFIDLIRACLKLFDGYMGIVSDILRVKFVYVPLLDNYIHTTSNCPNLAQIANALSKFNADRLNENTNAPYKTFLQSWDVSISNGIVKDKDGKAKLCQVTEYHSLGAFLYNELFNGFASGLLPKRCTNCGVFFLTDAYYNDFCENIAPNETMRTCRDVGPRRKFDEKVKSDPVWLAYQRAYKAHYARVMKKKMSKPDFTAWTDMAIELRGKALAGEVSVEEFVERVKV